MAVWRGLKTAAWGCEFIRIAAIEITGSCPKYTHQKEPESLLPHSGGGACRFHKNVWLHGNGSAK